ncbi:CIA30 family protein [Roseivirga sp.]|uniref:CIA30 family protein n=1 Tax=Roseivirga sp. TaxID=1964215 RepID=UPI003B8E1931
MTIALYLFLAIFSTPEEMVFDFGKGKSGENWAVVNDGVMGGLSNGKAVLTDDSMVFSGTVSLENNGGFTSLRAPYARYDLSVYDQVEIKYKSSGLDCALNVYQYQRFWRPNFKMPIASSNDEWKTISININELKEYRMGRVTGRTMSEGAAKNTIRLGFITDSKKEGSFKLEVAYIKFSTISEKS